MPAPWRDRSGRFSALKAATFAAMLIPGIAIAGAYALDELGARPIEEIIHETGQWALRFLLISLAITPARQIFQLPKLVAIRRMIGVAAFAYAVFHLVGFAADRMFDLWLVGSEIVLRYYLTIGAGVLLTLAALAATSTDAMVRRLGGKRWQSLHRLAYAAGLFAVVHFFMQSKLNVTEPIVMGGCFIWLMAFRVLARRSGTQKAASPLVLAALGLAIALTTMLGEVAYYGLFTRIKAIAVLQANLDPVNGLRPAGVLLLVGLGIALVAGARWAWERYRAAAAPSLSQPAQ